MKMCGKTSKEAAALILKCAALYDDPDFVMPSKTDEEEYERRYGWVDEVYELVSLVAGNEPGYLPEEPMYIGNDIDWRVPSHTVVRWTKKRKPRKDDLRRAIKAIEEDIAKLRYLKAVCEELLKM